MEGKEKMNRGPREDATAMAYDWLLWLTPLISTGRVRLHARVRNGPVSYHIRGRLRLGPPDSLPRVAVKSSAEG